MWTPFLVCVLSVPLVCADVSTRINPTSNWGIWQGWGTSLSWWAKAFGDNGSTSDMLADTLFTLNQMNFTGQSIPGLGLNIVRYNAGASTWNSIGSVSMTASPNIPASRQIEGYWLNWDSSDPTSSSWNWYADSAQRNMLWRARDRGVNHFELFSVSPIWWMCYNGNPSGANNGGDNLQSWNYAQHGIYLATIAQFAQQHWGFQFTSIEPFNEPMANWWVATTNQEGCHMDISTQQQVIRDLRTQLNNRGMTSTIISASDENTYDQAISTLRGLGNHVVSQIGRVNVHGYQYGHGRRDELYQLATSHNLPIWMSEYGENDISGYSLVSNLLLDFRWLHHTAWVYWQALDGYNWGLMDANQDAHTLSGVVYQKYYVLAQFTRHIREGMRILDGGSDYTVAAYDSNTCKLIIVAVNWRAPQYIAFDLSRFSQPSTDGALVSRWSTMIGLGEQYVAYQDTYMRGTQFWSFFKTNTVQTFEISNVRL